MVRGGEEISVPMLERVVYAAAMFHPQGALDGPEVPHLNSFFSFLKALPRVRFTRHLPALSSLSAILRRTFASQPTLAYGLLRLCSTCREVLALDLKEQQQLTPFGTLWLGDLADEDLTELRSAFEEIDECWGDQRVDAYERLTDFAREVIKVHNAVLPAAVPKFIPFRAIERKHVVPYIGIENTLVQVLAKEAHVDFDHIPQAWPRVVELLFEKLVERTSLWFSPDDEELPPRIRFGVDPSTTDILGFTSALLGNTLKTFLATRSPDIRAAIPQQSDGGPSPLRNAGLAVALAVLEDVGEDEKDDAHRLPTDRRLAHKLSKLVEERCGMPGAAGRAWALFHGALQALVTGPCPATLKEVVRFGDELWAAPVLAALQKLWP